MIPGEMRDRVLNAVLRAANARADTFRVGQIDGDLHLVELTDRRAVVVVVRGDGGSETETRARLAQVVDGHESGLMFVVMAGGGKERQALLQDVDRTARDRNHLGMYHADDAGHMVHVTGRRIDVVRDAARLLPNLPPLDLPTLQQFLQTMERERQDLVTFAQALSRRPHHAITVLGGLCVLMFCLTLAWSPKGTPSGLVLLLSGANSHGPLVDGQWWRLFSYSFLHGSVLHLAMNLLALLSLGGLVEKIIGWRPTVVAWAFTAAVGGAASAFIGGAPSSVGASGAVWGFITIALGIARPKQGLPRILATRLRGGLMWNLVLNLGLSFIPGIDLWAHFGGGLAGALLAITPWFKPKVVSDEGKEPATLRAGVWLAIAVMGASIGLALWNGRPWSIPQVGPVPQVAPADEDVI